MPSSFFNSFLIALTLLTRIPAKINTENEPDWAFAPAFFPIWGFILGILSSAALLPFFIILSQSPFPKEIVCILSPPLFLSLYLWLTRALHIDGFSDSIDAFSSMSADKEKRLAIMKDPHPGSTAVCAIFLLLSAKIAAIYIIIKSNIYKDINEAFPQIILTLSFILAFARVNTTMLAFFSKYPRQNGTGAKIIGKVSLPALLFAVISAVILAKITFSMSEIWLISSVISSLIIIANFIYWFYASNKKIGGVTGDILGAVTETTETSMLIAFSIILPMI